MASRTLLSSISSRFCFFLPLVMEKGNPGPSTVAVRVAARQRVPPRPDCGGSRPRGEGGGGEAMGEAGAEVVALGEEEDGAAHRPRPANDALPDGGPR